MKNSTLNWLFAFLLFLTQVIAIIFYGRYFKHILPTDNAKLLLTVSTSLPLYGYFQDIHVMIFVGFGFLLTSFHRFRLSSLTMCFWVAALGVQYYFLFNALWKGVFHKQWNDIRIDTTLLIYGEVSSAAILIAVCAIIGKTSSVQYVILTIFGSFLYTLNEMIVVDILKCRDVGGAMIIHAFGAFYGIGITAVYRHQSSLGSKNLFETHDSLTSAMVGTLFLWCFWPSFNAALAPSAAEIQIATLNTYFSIIASVISAYCTSVLLGKGRFTMSQILNATLAGGVVMGACADILYDGWVAYLVGSLTGIISCLCFAYVPKLLDKCKIHDVAGVTNLHAIPGVISGFLSAIFRAKYIDNKGGNQAAGTVISVSIGLFGGLLIGFLTKCFHPYENENDFFNDKAVVALEEFVVEELENYGHDHLTQSSKIRTQYVQDGAPGQPQETERDAPGQVQATGLFTYRDDNIPTDEGNRQNGEFYRKSNFESEKQKMTNQAVLNRGNHNGGNFGAYQNENQFGGR